MKSLLVFMKSIVLVALLAMSLFQISKLWFEDNSDRSFFYSVIPIGQNLKIAQLRDIEVLLQPSQLSIYFPKQDYRVIRRGASMYQNITDASVEIIKSALNKEAYKDASILPDSFWDQQHIMLKLPLVVEGRLIEENLGLSRNSLKEFESTETIVIVPAQANGAAVSVYIEDYASKVYYHYQVAASQIDQSNKLLVYFLDEFAKSPNASSYISTLKNGIKYYDDNILLPLPSPGIRYHKDLALSVPFVQNAELDEKAVTTYVTHFLDNPETMDAWGMNDGLIFKVPSGVTITYDTKGFLHYFKSFVDKPSYTDVTIALSAATNFLERDLREIPSEYYLRDYEIVEDNVIFYYDIGYNDFPIIMSEDMREVYALERSYPIIVSVAEDTVVEYKRVIRTIDDEMPQDSVLESRYEEALDSFVEEVGEGITKVEETYLGYKWSEFRGSMKLNWIITAGDGQQYFYEVQ